MSLETSYTPSQKIAVPAVYPDSRKGSYKAVIGFVPQREAFYEATRDISELDEAVLPMVWAEREFKAAQSIAEIGQILRNRLASYIFDYETDVTVVVDEGFLASQLSQFQGEMTSKELTGEFIAEVRRVLSDENLISESAEEDLGDDITDEGIILQETIPYPQKNVHEVVFTQIKPSTVMPQKAHIDNASPENFRLILREALKAVFQIQDRRVKQRL